MIDRGLVNVTDLVVKRPLRKGPAGDIVPGQDVTVLGPVRAIQERVHRVRKSRNGTDVVVEAVYFIDPLPPGVEVRERDLLVHTDPSSGRPIAAREVLYWSAWSLGPRVDHLELET